MWHFASTPFAGHHASYFQTYTNTLIPREKINSTYWGLRCFNAPFLHRLIYWLKKMNSINMRSKIPHPYESRPEHWPFLRSRFLLFYSAPNRKITCLGNPISYLSSSISIILTLFFPSFWFSNGMYWLLGWAVSYFPFLLIPRTMFNYHYLVPLVFAVMTEASLIDAIFSGKNLEIFKKIYYIIFQKNDIPYVSHISALEKQKDFSKNKKIIKAALVTTISCLSFISYLYFSPWIYGSSCPLCEKNRMFSKRWTNGPPKPIYFFAKDYFSKTKQKYGSIPYS